MGFNCGYFPSGTNDRWDGRFPKSFSNVRVSFTTPYARARPFTSRRNACGFSGYIRGVGVYNIILHERTIYIYIRVSW